LWEVSQGQSLKLREIVPDWEKPGSPDVAELPRLSGSFLVVISDEHGWPETVSGAVAGVVVRATARPSARRVARMHLEYVHHQPDRLQSLTGTPSDTGPVGKAAQQLTDGSRPADAAGLAAKLAAAEDSTEGLKNALSAFQEWRSDVQDVFAATGDNPDDRALLISALFLNGKDALTVQDGARALLGESPKADVRTILTGPDLTSRLTAMGAEVAGRTVSLDHKPGYARAVLLHLWQQRADIHPHLRGRVPCSLCGRKMQPATIRSRVYYRCEFKEEEAALYPGLTHPRTVYLREDTVCQALDRWIARAFPPNRLSATIEALTHASAAASTAEPQTPEQAQARQAIKDCERRLARYQAALDAGADPTIVTSGSTRRSVFLSCDPAQSQRGTQELDATGGAQVEAGRLSDAAQAVVNRVGVHVECVSRAAPVEVTVEEGGHRRGQAGLQVQRLQQGAQFGCAVRRSRQVVFEQHIPQPVQAWSARNGCDPACSFGRGRNLLRGARSCGAHDRRCRKTGGESVGDGVERSRRGQQDQATAFVRKAEDAALGQRGEPGERPTQQPACRHRCLGPEGPHAEYEVTGFQ
jgi:hypothetical protein